jgi:predicted dithiol-disulfide oxidoreductase (DUF899 family)
LIRYRGKRVHDEALVLKSAAKPGQDPSGAPDPAPLWMALEATPEGRGMDWYPKLDYV